MHFRKQEGIVYIDSSKKDAAGLFSHALYAQVLKKASPFHSIVILCIGTDRATGDSLGPLTGHRLSAHRFQNAFIYGTLDSPVHAKNLEASITQIYKNHCKPLIVAVDACLGRSSHIGYLTIEEGSVKPGAGVQKVLPAIGDISVTGIVNVSSSLDAMVLQNTRLNLVMRMAEIASIGIHYSIRQYEKLTGFPLQQVK